MQKNNEVHISVKESLLVLIVLFGILGYLIIGKQVTAQIPILIALTLLMIYGKIRGFSWNYIMSGIEDGIHPGIAPLVIFLMIGVLVACWIFSGTIPTIMYLGFKIISAKFFLPTVFVVCSLVAITCGSSFTTISTVGIAFIGISSVLGINVGLTAGAIVSGSFFGSNVSPLSGTTNLAAGIGEIDLYEHIKALVFTDIPAFIICLIAYFICGIGTHDNKLSSVITMMHQIQIHFWISVWTLIPVLVLLICAWFKVPAIPSIMFGSISGLLIGIVHNPKVTINLLANYVMNGYKAHTSSKMLNLLFSKGGISSMLSSASLIILALSLGGLLIKFNIIETLINSCIKFLTTPGKLISLTAFSSVLVNFLVGEQYLSIILPGQALEKTFDKQHVSRKYLTRTLNDAGAAVNSIVPWGVSGTFITGVLQINAAKYILFAFFPILVALLTIILGFTLKKDSNF